jgi:cardiolipin synthase
MSARYIGIVEDATGSKFRPGNSFTILQNGEEIFPAMLDAIKGAQHSIEFLSYVFWQSDIASQFAEALAERARAGVQVRLLVDAVGGAYISARTIWKLERAGVKVGWFRPGRWQYLRRFNNRTHRKILVVDGRVGFTGGVGIADIWTGHAQDKRHWRETHCRIEGAAVSDLRNGFVDSWREATSERLESSTPVPVSGDVAVHTTISSAERHPTQIERLMEAVFAAAEHQLWITSAYFVPTPSLVRSLVAAASRGVDVRILTNGDGTNHYITMLAGRATYHHLLAGGVKLYEYERTMHHAKVITVDGAWATIGSTNLDARSLVLNDELNVSVVDPHLISALDQQYLEDLDGARQIIPANWSQRSRLNRLFESGSSLFSDQL